MAKVEQVLHQWLRLPHTLHIGSDSSRVESPQTTIVFLHGLANSHAMWSTVIDSLPLNDSRIVTVDLLGFGDSPKPQWQVYSAETQAKALRATLVRKQITTPVLLVGHSLGALVAIKYAALYPKHVQSLVLCSPPFYKPPSPRTKRLATPQADDLYHKIYQYTRSHPERSRKLALAVSRLRLLSPSYSITDETLPAILSSMEMSIENQTSDLELIALKVPIRILYGILDPFIVKKNIKNIDDASTFVITKSVISGHEIVGSKNFMKATRDAIIIGLQELTAGAEAK